MSDVMKVLASVAIAAGVTAAVVATQVPWSGPEDQVPTFSHEQLEADRVMTLQMATGSDPAMELGMVGNDMLWRSRRDAYLRALEEHTRLYNQMAGLRP